MKVPDKSEFPGTGDTGNGISPNMQTQAQWLRSLKSGGCTACHQIGTKAMREIPKELGTFASSVAAWDRRIQSGQAGGGMSDGPQHLRPPARARDVRRLDRSHRRRRSAAGAAAPARHRAQHRHHAVGLGRSEIVPARFGVDRSPQPAAQSVRADLRRARAELRLRAGARSGEAHGQPRFRCRCAIRTRRRPIPKMPAPSPYWGDEVIWTSKNNVHNPMLDEKNRLWLTSAVTPSGQSRRLQGGIDASVGEGVSGEQREPPSADVRPADEEADAHQHVLTRRII